MGQAAEPAAPGLVQILPVATPPAEPGRHQNHQLTGEKCRNFLRFGDLGFRLESSI